MQQQTTPKMPVFNHESYTTPTLLSSLSQNKHLLNNSRTFISSRFKFKRSGKSQSHINTLKHPRVAQSHSSKREQAVSMLRLGEWLRLSASIHGFGRNVFDLALVMLKQVSSSLSLTYSLAAASLSLASKIDSSQHIKGLKQIPARTVGRFPRVSISEVISQEQRLLKALNFCVPVEYNRLLLLLQVGKRWNLYLKRNIRLLKLPLNLIQLGTKQNYQKANLKSVSYLLDLIILTFKHCRSEQEVYVIAAVVVVGALNCCQIGQINNQSYILIKFAKGFLRKCYKKPQRQLQFLVKLLGQIYEHELWRKIALIPPPQNNEQRLDLSEQQVSWNWLNQLQGIPFEEQISLQI